jgi:hypothetical protein
MRSSTVFLNDNLIITTATKGSTTTTTTKCQSRQDQEQDTPQRDLHHLLPSSAKTNFLFIQ